MSRPPSIYMRVPAKLSPGLQCAMRSTISRTGTLARRSIFCPFLMSVMTCLCLRWWKCYLSTTFLLNFCRYPTSSFGWANLSTHFQHHALTHTHTHTYAGSCHTLRTYVCLSHLYASSTRYPVILTKISACSHTYTLPATNHWQTKHLERRHRIYSKNVQTNWHTQYQQQRISWHDGHITSQDITWHDTSQLTTFNVHHVTSQTTRLLHPTPQPTSWHQNRSNHHHGTSPPWNSRRLVHSKEMVWASRWSVALRTFYRQILSLLYSSFFFWNFRPRLARELLVYIHGS